MAPAWFIGVHCGAGFHAQRLENSYKTAMADACRAGAAVIEAGGTPLEAAVRATTLLEDCPITNAGMGSNLTEDGTVECDAAVMDGRGVFGALGACPGVANPVEVAMRIAQESCHKMPLGRVRPIFLVGDKAREWALNRGLKAARSAAEAAEWNVTKNARKQWNRYTALLANAAPAWQIPMQPGSNPNPAAADALKPLDPTQPEYSTVSRAAATSHYAAGTAAQSKDLGGPSRFKRYKVGAETAGLVSHCSSGRDSEAEVLEEASLTYDTVGCICMNAAGQMAATVSSGGIAMKSCGRVGEAAVHGSGCWAADSRPAGRSADSQQGGKARQLPAVACSITGVGENIMRAALARTFCEELQRSTHCPEFVSTDIIQKHILDAAPPGPAVPKDCGIISLISQHGRLHFGVAHCSASMAHGYWEPSMAAPKCCIDRQLSYDADSPKIAAFGLRSKG